MLAIAALLIFMALVLFWLARRKTEAIGLPGGRIVYADTNRFEKVENPLYDAQRRLTGKPHYIVRQKDVYIPVEVKSSQVSDAPYDTHVYQLMAYCVLVERAYGVRPPYGLLHYPRRTFSIEYTPEMENNVLDLLEEIRTATKKTELLRSHNSAPRCARCGYRGMCNQKI